MDEYEVLLTDRALQDLDGIYGYISGSLQAPETALALADRLKTAILSLDHMPNRCPERRAGIYAGRGYRQPFAENYTVIYRVGEDKKQVIVITVRYSPSDF